MGLKKKLKQYGNLMVAILITIGFGATFLVYGGGGGGGAGSPSNQDQEQRNFTAPGQQYTEEGFNRSFREQVRIAAVENVVFVNAIYDNETQVEELRQLQQLQEIYRDKAYIQIVSSTQVPDVVTRNSVTEFPAVVVQGGLVSRNRLIPQQQKVENITVRNIEEAICSTLNNLGNAAARCQQIGAL